MRYRGARRTLITGGAGFISAHLLAARHEVLCADNFYSRRRTNIANLLSDPCFELLRHDVTFPVLITGINSSSAVEAPAYPAQFDRGHQHVVANRVPRGFALLPQPSRRHRPDAVESVERRTSGR